MKLYDHIEKHLGKIVEGWAPETGKFNIQVVRFDATPLKGVSTYSTLGLSNFVLNINEKKVRQEFVFSVYDHYSASEVASFLMTFAEYIADTGNGLLRGSIKMGGALIDDAVSNGVYASVPVFFADEFNVFDSTVPPVVFVWLIPISDKDADFIEANGWNEFEDRLEQNDCDFWSLNRNSIF
jgi:hypothetical protein